MNSLVLSVLRSKIKVKLEKISDHVCQKVDLIEQNIFDFVCKDHFDTDNQFNLAYINKSQQVYNLLKENTYIQHELDINELDLSKIAYIDYKIVRPQKWNLLQAELRVLDNKICDDEDAIYATDTFTCPNCHERRCMYTEVQIRSCDENATVFAKCLNCANVFCPT